MKLRNKKTGEIQDYVELILNKPFGETKQYESLSEFVEEWEDCKTAEPIIKDKKIRKAVRAWLAIQDQPIVAAAITCNKDSDGFFNYCLHGYIEKARISNGKPVVNNNLTAIDFEFRSLEKMEFERHRVYTIAELCGEGVE